MDKLYKLTDANGYSGTNLIQSKPLKWGPGVTHSALGSGKKLCSGGFIHAYTDPYVAVLLNPIHANFISPRLWEAEGDILIREGDLKCGCKTLTTTKEISIPEITFEQRQEIAIRSVMTLPNLTPEWICWAEKWLSGEDRTKESARILYDNLNSQEVVTASAATWAAWAAAKAAKAERWVREAVVVESAAVAVVKAAEAAGAAVVVSVIANTWNAVSISKINYPLDLPTLIRSVCCSNSKD